MSEVLCISVLRIEIVRNANKVAVVTVNILYYAFMSSSGLTTALRILLHL